MAEGYRYFRDRDGTLCRDNPRGPYEVWWPDSQEWSPYFWDSRDVVAITPVDAVRGWGAATIADFHEPHRDSG